MKTTLLNSLSSLFPPVPIFLSLVLFVFHSTVFAHRLDEYLQATLVVIEPERVRLQINLTPGVAVSEQVLSLIDRDRDGVISTNEAAAYAELLKRDLIVRLDKRELDLKFSNSYFPQVDELRTGLGFMQVEFSATLRRFPAGTHSLTVENRHLTKVSVFLINAAKPSASIQITKQIRNENQSNGEIEFTYQPPNTFNAMVIFAFLLILVVSVSIGSRLRTSETH